MVKYFCLACTEIYLLKLIFPPEFLFETISKRVKYYFYNVLTARAIPFKIKKYFLESK